MTEGSPRKQLRDHLAQRACPLCGERKWDFENAETVVLVKQDSGSAALRGARGTGSGDVGKALEDAFSSPRNVRLRKLTCDNCGHTELLDARKLGS